MRTEYCGLVDERFTGQPVELYGWVHRRRDQWRSDFHRSARSRRSGSDRLRSGPPAGILDGRGRAQRVTASGSRGTVRRRPEGTVNAALVSGQVEVLLSA